MKAAEAEAEAAERAGVGIAEQRQANFSAATTDASFAGKLKAPVAFPTTLIVLMHQARAASRTPLRYSPG